MTSAQNLANMSQDYGVIPMSNRNLFIDGHFDQWAPMSANVTPSTVYNGPVMWALSAGNGGAATIAAVDGRTNAGGLAFMDSPPLYYAQYQQTTVATSNPLLLQRMENVATGAGRSLTLSVKLWCGAGTVPITGIVLRQNFGNGTNSPSAQVLSDFVVNWAVTTSPKRFSVRLDVPSIAGKTIGNQGGDSLVVGFMLGFGTLFSLGIAEAQLEYSRAQSSGDLNGNGGEPTAFEYRGYGPELSRVHRFFYALSVGQYQGNFPTVFYSATAGQAKMYLPQPQRVNPPVFSVTGSGSWYTTVGGGAVSGVALGPIAGSDVTLALTSTVNQAIQASTLSNSSVNPFTLTFDARL